MRCRKCGRSYANSLAPCPSCGNTHLQSPRNSSTLIEFPATPRPQTETVVPAWRAEVTARVQESRARKAAITGSSATYASTSRGAAASALALDHEEFEDQVEEVEDHNHEQKEVNPIVEAALRRLQRVSSPSNPNGGSPASTPPAQTSRSTKPSPITSAKTVATSPLGSTLDAPTAMPASDQKSTRRLTSPAYGSTSGSKSLTQSTASAPLPAPISARKTEAAHRQTAKKTEAPMLPYESAEAPNRPAIESSQTAKTSGPLNNAAQASSAVSTRATTLALPSSNVEADTVAARTSDRIIPDLQTSARAEEYLESLTEAKYDRDCLEYDYEADLMSATSSKLDPDAQLDQLLHLGATEFDETARVAQRAVAGVIDLALVAVAESPFVAALWYLGVDLREPRVWGVMVGFMFLLGAIYSILSIGLVGRTGGMSITGIRVLSLNNGKQPTLLQASIRTVGKLVSAAPLLLGYLWAVLGTEHRTWHDLMSQTSVVREF